MSRADSSAGPSKSKKRSAPSDSENRNVPTSKVHKKVKTEELEYSLDLLKRRRRESSIAEDSKQAGISAMRSLVKPANAKPVPSASTKGKERAVEAENCVDAPTTASLCVMSELQILREKLEKQQKTLDAHNEFTSSITASLTCQICLEPMLRPYALAPCGHTSCYTCLVAWFRAPPAHIGIPPPVHLAHNFDRDNPTMLALGAPMLIRKDKTCPHCRAVVREAPVEAWAIKDIVVAAYSNKGGISESLFPGHSLPGHNLPPSTAPDGAHGDPWQGIFKRGRVHWVRNENGNAENEAADADEDAQERRGRGYYDEEDNAYRCTSCLHEIWGGVCSNCGLLYRGHDGHDSEGSDSFAGDPDYDDVGLVDWMGLDMIDAYWNDRAFDEMLEHGGLRREEEDADDGYESSFIDDDENLPAARIDYFDSGGEDYLEGSDGEEEGYDEVFELPRPRRTAPPAVIAPSRRRMSLSDDEESQSESDDDVHAARVHAVGRRRVLSDDEDEDEDEGEGEGEGEDEGEDEGEGEDEDEDDSEEDVRGPRRHANHPVIFNRLVRDWGHLGVFERAAIAHRRARGGVVSDDDDDESDDIVD